MPFMALLLQSEMVEDGRLNQVARHNDVLGKNTLIFLFNRITMQINAGV
jgi:hypothetical protein